MKKNIIYTTAAVFCLVFTGILSAENLNDGPKRRRPEQKRMQRVSPAKMVERMTQNLELTVEQKTKAVNFTKEFQNKASVIRNSESEKNEKREEMMKLRKELRKNLDSVLTPEQLEKSMKNRRTNKRERKQNRKGNRKQEKECGTCPNK